MNQYLNQSYYDFINEYLISEFKKLVADSKYSRYTLVALAELCGFSSRASFFRSFKKSTGVTPNEYIRMMRMKKAAELLLDGKFTVAEVSYKVGIDDPFYFSKCFKSQFGVAPSVYQKGKA